MKAIDSLKNQYVAEFTSYWEGEPQRKKQIIGLSPGIMYSWANLLDLSFLHVQADEQIFEF